MPELRQNPATKEWVVIATERAKRPEDFPKIPPPPEDPNAIDRCPFCEGHEKMTPAEVFAYRSYGTHPNEPGWWIRIVPNMFPALVPEGNLERFEKENFFRYMEGIGHHEVLIEHPHHNYSIATMEQKQVEEIFLAYRDRYISLCADPRFEMVLIFKNHGAGAGTSVRHPHSQIIATAITPQHLRHRLEEAMRYYDDNGKCLYCVMIEKERNAKERVLLETDNFIAFCPFASKSPFETWIIPKRHDACFNSVTVDDSKELAYVSRMILKKLHVSLNDPDYNYVIYSSPCREKASDYFHWHIQLVPRISAVAGFELGSGIFINTAIPEESAKFLREVQA